MSSSLRASRRGNPVGVIALRVAYHGRDFAGSQRQAGRRSVQGELEQAAARLFGVDVPIYLAGRTDRGVHAAGQVASFADYWPTLPADRLVMALNDHLPRDIAVIESARKPVGFHARYSACWREYRYRIWIGGRQPLVDDLVWTVPGRLRLEPIVTAAGRLVGERDFASLASGGQGVPWRPDSARGTVRRVLHCSATEIEPWWGARRGDGTLLEFRAVADGFLPRMVRGIVGLLVQVGRGAIDEAQVDRILASRDRRQAPENAPPHGLVLWAVGYEDWAVTDDQRSGVPAVVHG